MAEQPRRQRDRGRERLQVPRRHHHHEPPAALAHARQLRRHRLDMPARNEILPAAALGEGAHEEGVEIRPERRLSSAGPIGALPSPLAGEGWVRGSARKRLAARPVIASRSRLRPRRERGGPQPAHQLRHHQRVGRVARARTPRLGLGERPLVGLEQRNSSLIDRASPPAAPSTICRTVASSFVTRLTRPSSSTAVRCLSAAATSAPRCFARFGRPRGLPDRPARNRVATGGLPGPTACPSPSGRGLAGEGARGKGSSSCALKDAPGTESC